MNPPTRYSATKKLTVQPNFNDFQHTRSSDRGHLLHLKEWSYPTRWAEEVEQGI
jgi:hypothetical protein